jgi:hypothetical protein
MVEITIPIVLQIVQTVGILVGIIYYITIMRNSQKTQQLQLETRKAQLYMQLFMRITSEEFIKKSLDTLRLEYDNVDDFFEKYILGPDSSVHAKLFSMFWHIDGLGYMMSQKLIDPEMVYNFGGGFAQVWHWKKWEPVIMRFRKRRDDPEFLRWFEYTANEMMRMRQEKGLTQMPPIPSAWKPSAIS